MIKNFKEFATYKYNLTNPKKEQKNKDFYFLTKDKEIEILKLKRIEFLEVNNYYLNQLKIDFLSENRDYFDNIKYLSFWNTKIPDLDILKYFKNVEYLNIAHITDKNFNFNGIKNLEKLKTLCLLKTGKLENISSIGINNCIENLSIIQPTNIKNTIGIKNLTKLKYLNIEGSCDKTYQINNLEELEYLSLIEEIKFHYIKLPFNELMKLKNITNTIKLDIDTNLYLTEKYKELSLILKNVISPVFSPYIDRGEYLSFIIPIGKGKRIIQKSDKKFKEKIEKLVSEWNK